MTKECISCLKRVLSLLLLFALLISSFAFTPLIVSASNSDAITSVGIISGTTGDCNWTLDGTVLTISGNGKMKYSRDGNDIPYIKHSTYAGITKVIIEEGVTEIGSYAFHGCYNLTSVSIPSTVERIDTDAFSYCDKLPNIDIPNSVTYFGPYVFSGCDSLTNVVIPDSLDHISYGAFRCCENLTSITLYKSLVSIGEEAFYLCPLEEVYYYGTKNDWDSLYIKRDNDKLKVATLHYLERSNDISDCTITLTPTSYTYDGTAKQPSVTVKYGSTTLTKDTDYTVSYPSSCITPGNYILFVTGKGEYSGEVGKSFTIYPKEISSTTVTLSQNSYTYDGTEKKPTVTVKDGSKTLTNGTDYEVTYSNNTNAGTATVTVTGKGSYYTTEGNYTGSTTKNFTINAKSISSATVTLSQTSYTYDGTEKKPTVTVKDGTKTLTSGTDYTVSYSNNINAGTATVTVSGKGNYNSSTSKNFTIIEPTKINISNCTITLGTSSYTYDGSAKSPSVTVKYGSTTLKKDTDYSVSYSNNTNAGTATVTITGKGGYTGSTTKKFTISAKSISSANVTLSQTSYTYDGTEKKPTVTVKDGTKTLTSGTDYTVSYSNNKNVGAATVTVTGKGNYTGKATKDFTITKASSKSISDCSITLGATTCSYDGYRKEPTVVIKDGTKVLSNGIDYTLSYSNNRDVGKATITIRGIGNYSGTAYAYFTIERTDNKPLLGDADGNGSIEVCDATFIQRFTALMDVVNTFNEYLADVNKDGNADLLDASCIQRYLVNLQVNENIGFVDEDEPQASAETTIEYDNGDYVFVPSDKNLAYDDEESMIYYNNSLSVYLLSDICESEENRLVSLCNGTVSGRIQGEINVLQIKVTPSDIHTLDCYSNRLMEENNVLYASYDFPVAIENEDDNNPWTNNGKGNPISDKGQEDVHTGNDWWAESIGAYRAWSYSSTISNPVKVGIIEGGGIDTSHEEFFDNNSSSKIKVLTSNVAKDHGTHVAGIIAAADNNRGIRGIADKSELIDASINYNEELSLFPQFAEKTKEMINLGAFVINNSWGSNKPLSREEFEKKEWNNQGGYNLSYWYYKKAWHEFLDNNNEYNEYLEYMNSYRYKTAMACIIMIIQLDRSNKDFLIVQSAGNKGENVIDTFLYRSIDEGLFLELDTRYSKKLSKIISYDDVRDHILVVGAVKNSIENGAYKFWDNSNWGSNVDIVAPGKSILSTLTTKDDAENAFDENNGKMYGFLSGTSMAAPMVTGSVALIKSIDPTLNSKEIKNIIIEKSNRAVDKYGNEYPMLNIGDAVEFVVENRINVKKPFISKRFNIHHDGIRISNGSELHDKISTNPSGTFYLANDIDLSEYGDWDMIPEFSGTLYGNGFTIKNLCIQRSDDSYNYDNNIAAMFRNLNNAKIYDLGFESALVDTMEVNDGYSGVIAAFAESSIIENCYIDDSSVDASNMAGGFVAYANKTKFKNLYSNAVIFGWCYADDDYVGSSFGGIVGYYSDPYRNVDTAFDTCIVDTNAVDANVDDDEWVESGRLCVGGIVGDLNATTGSSQYMWSEEGGKRSPKPITFSGCSFNGEVYGHGGYARDYETLSSGKTKYYTCDVYSGGLIGYTTTDWGSGSGAYSGMVLVNDCTISANITSSTMGMAYTGGVIGYAQVFTESEYGVEINNTNFNGTINAYYEHYGEYEECDIAHIGGAIGYTTSRCLIQNVVIEGEMVVCSGWGLYLGGLVGEAPSESKITIIDCDASSNLDADIDTRATDSFRNIGTLVGKYD